MDELNAGLAAAQGAADACAATVDELCKAAKQSVGDLRAANDRLRHRLAEKDEQLAMAHDHLLHKEEELVRTRAALLVAQDQLAKARAGYFRGDAAEESPLRINSPIPMTITQLPSWSDGSQLALGKPKGDAEASSSHGEASFRPALCEACNVAMVTKQDMEDHLGGRKHRRAMERLRRERGAP